METLQYNNFISVSSFLSTESHPHYPSHPHSYIPTYQCQPQPINNHLYPFSTSPTSNVRNSPVTEISNTLHAFTVSSPESPTQAALSTSPPAPSTKATRPSRVRRNLSLSMDNWCPPPSSPLLSSASLPDLSTSRPKSSLSSTCFFSDNMVDDVLVVDPPAEKTSPCKSPKRARGDEVDVAEEVGTLSFSLPFTLLTTCDC